MELVIQQNGIFQSKSLVGEGPWTIGRQEDNFVVLSDRMVSRHHAELRLDAGGWKIVDVGSQAGTFVDGVRIDCSTAVSTGSAISVGSVKLTLRDRVEGGGDGPGDRPDDREAPDPDQGSKEQGPEAARPPAFDEAFKDVGVLYSDKMMAFKAMVHGLVLSRLNVTGDNTQIQNDARLAESAEKCLDQVLREMSHELPDDIPIDVLRQSLIDELLGFGPLSPMIRRSDISEIMVNGPDRVFVESKGRLYETGVRFFNEKHLIQIIQRIVEPLGRHVDEASPMVDARLPDGSRVNAIIPPLALDGASLTIRKFSEKKLTTEDLIGFGSMTSDMAKFLAAAVKARQNILVSGGTGSGKTTLLNILSQFIPEGERVVTVEDSAELKLSHRNIVRLEARPANIEGKGRITIRDLVINCLRMRPDRIIVGECRGSEALDMLQAMNTGHDGSLTTAHANNPRDALSRLENMVMMAGYDLPSTAIREQISSAIDIIVQQTRLGDGTRKIVKIVEVTGREGDVIQMQDIFVFRQTGIGPGGKVEGEYCATGNIPFFIEEQRRRNVLDLDMDVFVPKA